MMRTRLRQCLKSQKFQHSAADTGRNCKKNNTDQLEIL